MVSTTKMAAALLIILSTTLSLLTLSDGQQPPPPPTPLHGRWKLIKRSIGISAMHMALMPGGRVVIYDRTDFGLSNISMPNGRCRDDNNDKAIKHDCSAHSVEFDPRTRAVRPLTVLTDTFCSSGALSPDGRLVQSGGWNDGNHAVRFISPCDACDWNETLNGLRQPRWYSTDQILPDGRIIVVGGRKQFNYEFIPRFITNDDHAYYNLPFLVETSDASENNLYPFLHLAPDGNLFLFARTKSILLNYTTNKVVKSFPDIPGEFARNYPSTGSSVLLPLRLDAAGAAAAAEVLVCGGTVPTANFMAANKSTFLPAASTCGRMAITGESPEWEMSEMPMGRVMGDMVLLPTGDVLIVNGAGRGSAGWGVAREPVLHPVVYSTANRSFETMTPSAIPRLYHSTALLLPDGRVLVGGSNPNTLYRFTGVFYPTDLSLEVFYPPYFGQPAVPRPRIKVIQQGVEIVYGQKLAIDFAAARSSTTSNGELVGDGHEVTVTMVAPAFNTHSFSMNARVLVLDVQGVRRIAGRIYTVDTVAPGGATVAPPGYYMVFVVQGGVPSHGMWVRIKQ